MADRTDASSNRIVAAPNPNDRSVSVNNIIWLVGAVVIILAILGFLGLR